VALYRPEAVAGRHQQPFGEVIAWRSPGLQRFVAGLAFVCVCSVTVLLNRDYHATTTVGGYTESSDGIAQVRSATSGVVSNLHVRQDQWVETEHAGEIDQQVFTQRQAELQARRQHLFDRTDFIDAELHIGRERLLLAAAELKAATRLFEQGVVTRKDLAVRQEAHLGLRGRLIRLESERADTEASRQALEGELLRRISERAVEKGSRTLQRIRLEAALEDLDESTHTLEVAPRAGWIGAISVKVGDRVTAGAPLVVVGGKPDGGRVVLHVPSRAIGEIKIGNRVRLRYDGFAYQKFGFGMGRVDAIGTAAFAALERGERMEPVFKVDVEVMSSPVKQTANGMRVQADVITRVQPVWRWLVQPLLGFNQW
jgi:membrane fusion protein